MKIRLLITVLTLISSISFSQRKITGIVYSKQGNEIENLAGAKIQELGTDNFTNSNIDGTYTIITLFDTCTLNYSFVGFADKNVKIESDTIIDIKLPIWNYRTNWFTIGTNYDLINSYFGFSFSNGFDEQPLIHFEEFSSDFMYKISGQTNFRNDYSYNAQLACNYPIRWFYIISMEYSKTNFTSINFDYRNVCLATDITIPRIYTGLLIKFGYQELNNNNNFGFQVGLEKVICKTDIGFLYGYYFDYSVYKLYLQRFIYKHFISLRFDYEKINSFDFLNCGIHFSINRTKLNGYKLMCHCVILLVFNYLSLRISFE